MGSLFTGTPQTATSYATSTSQTPNWMQDAIFNQINWAQNIANRPATGMPTQSVAALDPAQLAAYNAAQANVGAWQPQLTAASTGMQNLANAPGSLAAASPYLTQAAGMSGVGAASPYLAQAAGMDGMTAASPYLAQAGQSSVANVGAYMNPYQQNVLDTIAKQGARNLTENLLPGISDQFIRAGSFGGTRMGEFGSRALRDTQEAILNQQSQAAQQGYTQALGASQADLARQQQLASTAGQLTQAQQQALANIGSQYGQLTNAQQQALANIGQQTGQLTQADMQQQQSALSQMAQMAQQGQQLRTADVAALQAAGQQQQQQAQNVANTAYQNAMTQWNYPQSQLDWLSTQVRGMAPITPQTQTQATTNVGGTYSPSPFSQLASGLALYQGLNNLGSDPAIKENVVAIGKLDNGLVLYTFEYKPEYKETWGDGTHVGVMADEVEKIMPDAVARHPDGYRMVDYGKVFGTA